MAARRRAAARGKLVTVACGALIACGLLACTSDASDATTTGDPLRQATASAVLDSLHDSGVSATATFVATASGVDLALTMRGCPGGAATPIRIVDAPDCAGVSSASDAWAGGRGDGIPGVLCTGPSSGEGLLRYSRRNALPSHWAVGGGSPADVVGRAVALVDPGTLAPIACGVIIRGPDRTLVPTPPLDQAPSVATRARVAGSCFSELMAGAPIGACSDPAELDACATEHCELGACLAHCASLTACLDASSDPCAAVFTCATSAECATCQLAVQSCTYGFCGAHLACPAIPRPGGPCSQMTACCTLQAERAGGCLEITELLATLGGDPSCINGLSDWDVVSHMHVPCDTQAAFDAAVAHVPDGSSPIGLDGAPCMTAADCGADELCVGTTNTAVLNVPGRCLARAETMTLTDGMAGRACSGDAACGTGRCAPSTALLTPFPDGYCTTTCYADATCGRGGVCVLATGSTEPGVCYQGCAIDSDCEREHYRCTPLGDGARVVSVCYPRRDALPDGVVGRPCAEAEDCGEGASCEQGLPLSFLEATVPAPGGYCSAPCLYDVDCGARAQCISGGMSGGQCLASCDEQTPCRDGYRCFAHQRDGDPAQTVCVPIWDDGE